MTDIAIRETPALATVLGVSPSKMMDYAVEISETLTRVLREKGLTKRFGQGEHVLVEGWELAGSLLGLTVTEKTCREEPDGSFTCEVTLQNPTTGKTLATASGYCGTDEQTWKNKPKYARRSMAMTRAIGRVYRQNFSWLIKLAGFEPTPAEEMPEAVRDEGPEIEIFTDTPAQGTRLAALLKQENFPEDLWDHVGRSMMGKPMTLSYVKAAMTKFTSAGSTKVSDP